MSWLMATVYDRLLEQSEAACLRAWRRDLLAGVTGRVLEVGAGTGLNVPHYSANVTRLVLSEPEAHMRAKLQTRLTTALPADVELSEATLDHLPMPDQSFDAVVSTLVLCSVPDLAQALGEIRRVLAPGGRLVFLEHVGAEDRPDRLKWQRRVEPLWKALAGNCHLTRRTESAIKRAGFDIVQIERESIRKAMSLTRPSIRGIAVRST
jgi:ubiquinone/menaquinone biosynthesis C-methylase UbiE